MLNHQIIIVTIVVVVVVVVIATTTITIIKIKMITHQNLLNKIIQRRFMKILKLVRIYCVLKPLIKILVIMHIGDTLFIFISKYTV
jgi:hypothetical protein